MKINKNKLIKHLHVSLLGVMATGATAALPDWSDAGYLNGAGLPSASSFTTNNNCIVTASELSSGFGVYANDGADDSAGLQAAVDYIGANCAGNYQNLSRIELPSGELNINTEIHVDTSFLVIRGKGNNPSASTATRIVFTPSNDTAYLGMSDFDLNDLTDAGGGKGGWIWPGRGAFRVQTRGVHSSYANSYNTAPANRKDFYEGSVNFHWKHKNVTASASVGDTTIKIQDVSNFNVGGYVWVGAANTHKMYDQQNVQNADRINMHMRQQIFKVLAINSSNKTLTLDKPLEFDLPVNSTGDGSSAISGSYNSRAVALTMVEGVGFENFYLTQTGPSGYTAQDAKHNYNNLDHQRAMMGIVFKWAANSYVSNVRTFMTGSHPLVTEMAINLQFENNYLEGSWNKGKGGNGYVRGSKLWRSLIKNNTLRDLRHLTLQWSASGNVITGNNIDADINLHGGWERNNLIENNTVAVPYHHRDCNPGCGAGDGTWYPIWWAAGYHAGGWSGASGPRNVFFSNSKIGRAHV